MPVECARVSTITDVSGISFIALKYINMYRILTILVVLNSSCKELQNGTEPVEIRYILICRASELLTCYSIPSSFNGG